MDQKKLRIWTLFTQWLLLNFIPMFPLISMPYSIMQQMEEDIKKNTFSIFYYTNWWQFIWINWWTLRKMYEKMGFCWPIFSRKKIKSWILSSYWKILLSRNPYSRIFYSVEYFGNTFTAHFSYRNKCRKFNWPDLISEVSRGNSS